MSVVAAPPESSSVSIRDTSSGPDKLSQSEAPLGCKTCKTGSSQQRERLPDPRKLSVCERPNKNQSTVYDAVSRCLVDIHLELQHISYCQQRKGI